MAGGGVSHGARPGIEVARSSGTGSSRVVFVARRRPARHARQPDGARTAGRNRRARHPERQELLALMCLGRGDYDADSWPKAMRHAGETMSANFTDYLVGTPLPGDLPRRRSRRPRFVARGFRERLIPPFFAE